MSDLLDWSKVPMVPEPEYNVEIRDINAVKSYVQRVGIVLLMLANPNRHNSLTLYPYNPLDVNYDSIYSHNYFKNSSEPEGHRGIDFYTNAQYINAVELS